MTESTRAPKNMPPIDLQHFLNAVLLAAEMEGGFGLGDVARVEEAWEIADMAIISHGYVVALADGQRVYLEYTVDDSGAGPAEEIAIDPLAPGIERPDLAETGRGVYCTGPTTSRTILPLSAAGLLRVTSDFHVWSHKACRPMQLLHPMQQLQIPQVLLHRRRA